MHIDVKRAYIRAIRFNYDNIKVSHIKYIKKYYIRK